MQSATNNNASDCNTAETDMNAISTDSDMTVDLIDFVDGIVELVDCSVSDQNNNSDCCDLADDSGVELYNASIDSSDS